jgi:hypothetical protein
MAKSKSFWDRFKDSVLTTGSETAGGAKKSKAKPKRKKAKAKPKAKSATTKKKSSKPKTKRKPARKAKR